MSLHRASRGYPAIAILCAAFVTAGLAQTSGSSPQASEAQALPSKAATSPEFERLAKQANDAREADHLPEAISLYQQALRLHSNWDEGWWYLGMTLYSLDRYSEALDAFRHLMADRPKHGPTRALLGLCEFQLRDYDRALSDLQEAQSLGLGDNPLLVSVSRFNLAILLNRFGQFEQAYDLLQKFVFERDQDPGLVEALGLSVLQAPYLPEELPPDKYDMVRTAGQAAFAAASGRGEEAEKLYRVLLARYPEAANVHYAHGVYLLPGSPDQALEEFSRELQISPSHVFARLQIAKEYLRRNNFPAALPYARQAVEIAPKLFVAHEILGRVYLETGDVKRAIQELETAAQLEPQSADTHFQLARAYDKAGRKKEGARERAEFLRLDQTQHPQPEGRGAVGQQAPQPTKPPEAGKPPS
jgi:tetratricopeptide (TPR) repeat protein